MDGWAIVSLLGLVMAAAGKDEGSTSGGKVETKLATLKWCDRMKGPNVHVSTEAAGTYTHQHVSPGLTAKSVNDLLARKTWDFNIAGPAGDAYDLRHGHDLKLNEAQLAELADKGQVTVESGPMRKGDTVGGHTHAVTISCRR